MTKITAIIPAHNEAKSISAIVAKTTPYVNEVIVVDDGSQDETSAVAVAAGAKLICQTNAGYIAAIKRGFLEAQGDIVVTLDADGEHHPADIPRLVAPILTHKADLVLGARSHIARASERFLNWLTRLRVNSISDTGTGFRAMRRDLASRLELNGRCICGISVLEPIAPGARVTEVPIALGYTDKPRRIAWYHLLQTWYVLYWLIKSGRRSDH